MRPRGNRNGALWRGIRQAAPTDSCRNRAYLSESCFSYTLSTLIRGFFNES